MNKSIILFDGECNLCNRLLQFLIKWDKKNLYQFASLQSETAKLLLPSYAVAVNINSVVLLQSGFAYTQSTAVIRILSGLGFWWKGLAVFYIIPPLIRNKVYDFIAKNRYRFFGKSNNCRIATDPNNHRFLE